VVRRIVEFGRTLDGRCATHVAVLPFGIARLCPDLREVYDASGVELTGRVDADDLLSVTDSLYATAGLRHRRVHTTVAELAPAVGPALIARGWSPDQRVYMAHDRRASTGRAFHGCAVVDIDTWAPAARAFMADQEWGRDPAVVADMEAYDRRMAARIDVRFVLTDDATAGCHIYRLGDIAQIERIYVLTGARGGGVGRTLLAGALHACRDAEVVFLIADAGGWQRQWYARAGFAAVTMGWNWLRRPAKDA
jgi:GNAT superfamily N-acetyltransferase